jgi:putative inorganic carbon (hco3(-)) transporter
VPLAYGVLASESRGGVVTFAAIAIAGFFVFRRQRVQVLAVTVAAVAVLGLWFSADTAAWDRMMSAREDRGSGRTDLWTIAVRMWEDHPVAGVGLDNFPVHSPDYTRLPGSMTGVMHVEREQEAHNAYLSLLAETGIIGLMLFLAVAGAVVAATARSIRGFESLHDRRGALLARALLVAMVGMLSAAFFLPNAADKRIWVLMGLGVVSLALAERASRAQRALGP